MLIAGCTQQAPAPVQTPVATTQATPAATATAAAETTAPAAGMANPASVNCGAVGGKTEIKTAADGGQYGMCTFANGTTCEEWALFRNEGCKPYVPATTAPAAAANVTTAIPATTAAAAVNVTTSAAAANATVPATTAPAANATAVNATAKP